MDVLVIVAEVICCYLVVFGVGVLIGANLSMPGRHTGNVSPETRRALDNPATRYRIVDAWRYLNRGGKPKRRRAG